MKDGNGLARGRRQKTVDLLTVSGILFLVQRLRVMVSSRFFLFRPYRSGGNSFLFLQLYLSMKSLDSKEAPGRPLEMPDPGRNKRDVS